MNSLFAVLGYHAASGYDYLSVAHYTTATIEIYQCISFNSMLNYTPVATLSINILCNTFIFLAHSSIFFLSVFSSMQNLTV